MTFKLLCCDGGGIRGLMTALLIQDLDQAHSIIAKADGFAGTSTGGLIALGLSNNVPIDRIISIYENDGSTIFTVNEWPWDQPPGLASVAQDNRQALLSGPGVGYCQYTNDGLIKIASSILGDQRLSDAKKYVAINTARLWNGSRWVPTTFSNAPNNTYKDVKMVDAALATSAAPTYFPPYEIDKTLGFFADGGTFANNPTLSAIADALVGKRISAVSDVCALSLGTGKVSEGIPPSSIPEPLLWGAYYWMYPFADKPVPAMPLLDLMMAGTAEEAATQARQLLAEQFCRGNVPLPNPYPLDDWQNVGELRKRTAKYVASSEWQQVRAWVGKYWT